MAKWITPWICVVLIVLAGGLYAYLQATAASPETGYTPGVKAPEAGARSLPPAIFADEPDAHARYDRMREALVAAQSLYYQGDYTFGRLDGSFRQSCVYTMWLKKPNFVRLEASGKGCRAAAGFGVDVHEML